MIALRLRHQFACLAVLSLLLAACAGKPPPPPSKPAAAYKIGKPYQIAGVWYYPREQPDYDETGIASWYGPGFHGKPTALGEIYDMNALTAAHKTLPLPVTVRVTNLENGRSILMRVNDRGPFVAGRIIDVSRRGAQLLGFGATGTAPVRVQIQDGGGKPGTFIATRPQTSAEEKALVAAVPSSGVSSQVLPGSVAGPKIKSVTPAGGKPAPLDIANRPGTEAELPPEPQVEFRPVPPVRNIYVQVGAFRDLVNAERLRGRLLRAEPGFHVSAKVVDGKSFYRVRTGPLATVEIADATLARVLASGQTSAQIIVD